MKRILVLMLAGSMILFFTACCENKQDIGESSDYEWCDSIPYFESDASNGQTIYRTPYGKRYHDDPDCGGKNSYEITIQQAKEAGLTPCKRCIE